jgi:DNA-3-methyladenine glycosylase
VANSIKKLPRSFYKRDDVVLIARELLGKFLMTNIKGKITGGMITETEAYAGKTDLASHAKGGRRTARTEIMFGEGGTAYVYLCYGIHHMFNVVTNDKDIPHAILIRALEPTDGINTMLKRRLFSEVKPPLTTGPGSLSQALGIHTTMSGEDLLGNKIWIEDRGIVLTKDDIVESKRVGVKYSGVDAHRLYRFMIKGNRWVSKPLFPHYQ